MSIAENIASIRKQMEQAALQAGRDPKEIKLCAATKMNDADAVRQAIAAGVDCCGENRVQELKQKLSENAAGEIIKNISISGMIEEKINEMPVEELEKLVHLAEKFS